MAYIWQDQSWPNFTWDAAKLLPILSSTLRMEASFIEKMKGLGKKGEELTLEAMADEVISSSAIEGIYFDRSSVRSSILRRLGIETEGIDTSDRHAENAASLLIGALMCFIKRKSPNYHEEFPSIIIPVSRVGKESHLYSTICLFIGDCLSLQSTLPVSTRCP